MKRTLIAGAFALAAGGQAFAADLPPGPSPPPRAPATYIPTTAPAYNWGGVYFGINGGYAIGSSDWTDTTANATSGSFNTSGGLVGGTIGANFQASQLVFGIEADLDWTDITGSSDTSTCGPNVSCQTQNSWLGTARGRFGYAADRILIYATGGAAFGNIEASMPGGTTGTDTTNKVGWTAGGGIEAALGDNFTARIEYLYVDLGSGACPTVCGGDTVSIPFTANVIRAGLDYKFGGR